MNSVFCNLDLRRSNTAATNDFFNAWPFPVPAVNPAKTNNIYVAFADKGTNANDRADVFFVCSTNGGTNWTAPVRLNTDAVMKLQTGGKATSHRQNLFCISASATNMLDKYSQAQMSGDDVVWTGTGETANIPPTSISIDGKTLDADGNLWVALPDNTSNDVTPIVKGSDFYTFNVDQQKYTLVHETVHPALTDTNLDRLNLGVGEEVNFSFNPTLPINGTWLVTAGGLNTNVAPNVLFTAPSNAPSGSGLVVVRVAVPNGEHVYELFKVFEPGGVDVNLTHITSTYTNYYPPGFAGAHMDVNVYMAPTDVSFYRVEMGEVPGPATNVWGYYTNFPPQDLQHTTAGHFWLLTSDNNWSDECYEDASPWPWSGGGYTWSIPWKWKIGSGPTNFPATGWDQVVTIDSSGTISITKFLYQNVTRGTNNVTVPWL